MSTKIKTSILDILSGLIALVIINSISRYIYFNYITCSICTAIIFLLIGIIRGSNQVLPILLKVFFINIFTIISIKIVPLPAALFLPIQLVAIIFSFIGLYIRIKWTSGAKIKYTIPDRFDRVKPNTDSYSSNKRNKKECGKSQE